MRILVVGGFGYLGSVLTDMLSRSGHEVDVYDIKLWGDCSKDISFKEDIKNIYQVKDYDVGFWCAHPDFEEFFKIPNIGSYLDHLYSIITMTKKACKRLIFCSTFLVECYEENSDMIENFKMYEENYEFIRIPSLYGASPRMRWDTTVNQMIFEAIIKQEILLGNDCLQSVPVASVNDMAITLIDQINVKTIQKNFCTDYCSMLDLAHMVGHYFEAPVKVVGGDLITRRYRKNYGTWMLKPTCNIKEACGIIKKNLEQGNLPDFVNDSYNNETMIKSLISSLELRNRLGV